MTETLFISDLHLSREHPATLALALRFFDQVASRADRLYILGDLFDVWLGDDDITPPIPEFSAALVRLSEQGTHVYLMHGNRDFLLGEKFCQATGCTLLPDPSVIELEGERALLMHGDLLCTDDHGYQEARQKLRSPETIAYLLSRSLAERAAMAADMRRRSGEATSLLAEEIMDVNETAVREQLLQHHARLLIHGHTHRPAIHTFELEEKPARRIVLAEWTDEGGSYLRVGAGGLEQIAYP
jgi:UDP-2,3-diacylglucosamine hydrolase